MHRVMYDPQRAALLCCLAARKLPGSVETLDRPRELRLFVETHEEPMSGTYVDLLPSYHNQCVLS